MSAITGLMYGSQYFQADDKPFYHRGLVIMIGVVSAGAALVLLQEGIYWLWNQRARASNAQEEDQTKYKRLYVP